jgi:hypothetical protein
VNASTQHEVHSFAICILKTHLACLYIVFCLSGTVLVRTCHSER